MKDIWLDIGIGQGGAYLTRDSGIVRVGLDIEVSDLTLCKARYGREGLAQT